MSNYLESNLTKDEVVVGRAELHKMPFKAAKIAFIAFCILAVVMLIAFGFFAVFSMLFGIGCVGYGILELRAIELGFTNKRLVGKVGFLSINRVDIPLNKADSISVTQGIIGRMFGFGTIVVASTASKQVEFPLIENPDEFRTKLMEQITKFDDDRIKKQAMEMMGAMQK